MPSAFQQQAIVSPVVAAFHQALNRFSAHLAKMTPQPLIAHTAPNDAGYIDPQSVLKANDERYTVLNHRRFSIYDEDYPGDTALVGPPMLAVSLINEAETPEGEFLQTLIGSIEELFEEYGPLSDFGEDLRRSVNETLLRSIQQRGPGYGKSGIGFVASTDKDFLAAKIPFVEFSMAERSFIAVNSPWLDQIRQIWETASEKHRAALILYFAEKLNHALQHDRQSPASLEEKHLNEATVLSNEAKTMRALKDPALQMWGSPEYQDLMDDLFKTYPELIANDKQIIHSGKHYGPGGYLDQIWTTRDEDPALPMRLAESFGGGPQVHTSPASKGPDAEQEPEGVQRINPRSKVFAVYVHPVNEDDVDTVQEFKRRLHLGKGTIFTVVSPYMNGSTQDRVKRISLAHEDGAGIPDSEWIQKILRRGKDLTLILAGSAWCACHFYSFQDIINKFAEIHKADPAVHIKIFFPRRYIEGMDTFVPHVGSFDQQISMYKAAVENAGLKYSFYVNGQVLTNCQGRNPAVQVVLVDDVPVTKGPTTVANSNGAYQIEQWMAPYLESHPLLNSMMMFVEGLGLTWGLMSAIGLLSTPAFVIALFGIGFFAFKPWIAKTWKSFAVKSNITPFLERMTAAA